MANAIGAASLPAGVGGAQPLPCRDGQCAIQKPERESPWGLSRSFSEGAVTNLPDAFAGHAQKRADLLERAFLPVVQTVVEVEGSCAPAR